VPPYRIRQAFTYAGLDLPVKAVHTDSGHEFCGTAFDEFFRG